jgi:hypothetical protein
MFDNLQTVREAELIRERDEARQQLTEARALLLAVRKSGVGYFSAEFLEKVQRAVEAGGDRDRP